MKFDDNAPWELRQLARRIYGKLAVEDVNSPERNKRRCRIYTGAKDTHGIAPKNDYSHLAHVVVNLACNGARPNGFETSHLCGNPLCVEPRHLKWDTHAGNLTLGKRKGYRKLTREQNADVVRKRKAGYSVQSLADEFKVEPRAIRYILKKGGVTGRRHDDEAPGVLGELLY